MGEVSALHWLVDHGYDVYLPFGHSPDVDLMADRDGIITRVQVKTTGQDTGARFPVAICTRGGNQSWSGMTKRFSPDRCDRLFVHVANGRRWFIPSTAVEASTGIVLGGPKYAEFEVEPGAPLALHVAA